MRKSIAVFLLAALTLTILAGCQSVNVEAPIPNFDGAASIVNLQMQEPVTPTVTVPKVTTLSPQEAEAMALAHAELKAEDVRMERTELDRDDGILHYDVEFTTGDYEYDYEIDAVSGEVLRWDREYEPKKNTKPEPPATQPEVSATQPEETMLTAEEAEAIALAHAGLKAEEVRFDKTERDREDGTLVYEVEFRVGNWEYSYEIDAYTGKILEWEKEFDD